jgi:hypothetical protein
LICILQSSYQINSMPEYRNPLEIKINLDWVKRPSDQSTCTECKMMIVSKEMWQLVIFVGYEPIETKFKVCESCYDRS